MKSVLLCVLAVVSACSQNASDSTATPKPSPVENLFSLVGVADAAYRSECRKQTDGNGTSDYTTIRFAANSFERVWSSFDGDDCSVAKQSVTYIDHLSSVEKRLTPEIEGWMSFRYFYEAIEVVPQSPYITDIFKERKIYGHEDWKIHEARDVTGRRYNESSSAMPAKGDARASTVKIEGDILYMARYVNNVAVADQPIVFKRLTD